MGEFTRDDKAAVTRALESVLTRFPRLKERYSVGGGPELQRAANAGHRPGADVRSETVAAGRAVSRHRAKTGPGNHEVDHGDQPGEKVSVLLVEQNSRMALQISHRVYELSTGEVALAGDSKELLADDRIRTLYLGGEV